MQKLVVGFSGTRKGMTPIAASRLAMLLVELQPTEAHHGDCVGSDAQFHAEIVDWVSKCKLVIHPGFVQPMYRAHCISGNPRILQERPTLERNRHIVQTTDVLIATPGTAVEVTRSGTWATIRYARRMKRPLILILPDGSINLEFPDDADVPSLRDAALTQELQTQYGLKYQIEKLDSSIKTLNKAMQKQARRNALPTEWASKEWR